MNGSMANTFAASSVASLFDGFGYLFDQERKECFFHKIVCFLTHRPYQLLDLNSYPVQKTYGNYAGVQEVALDEIRGTEGRLNDFDDRFHPRSDRTRQRWMSVARAYEMGMDLPPVDLIQVGDVYFVRDGHHRVSVARAFGRTTISARVTVW